MPDRDAEFLKRLRATFAGEAVEHLAAIRSGLHELEAGPARERLGEILESVFRATHSLKGAARVVKLTDAETVCQTLESLLSKFRANRRALPRALADAIFEAAALVEKLVASDEGKRGVGDAAAANAMCRRLEQAAKGETEAQEPVRGEFAAEDRFPTREVLWATSASPAPGAMTPARAASPAAGGTSSLTTETLRISRARLETILLQAEEMVNVQLTGREHVAALRELRSEFSSWNTEWEKISRVAGRMRRELERAGDASAMSEDERAAFRLLEFLEWNRGYLQLLESRVETTMRRLEADGRTLTTVVDRLLESAKEIAMVPGASALEAFPTFVRQLARDQGKEAQLAIEGAEVELDRRILEEIRDPLTHLIRNCIDHGIEPPAERERRGKPREGAVRLALSQKDGDKIEIVLSDDGAGIDIERVKVAAGKAGIAVPQRDDDVLQLIFLSGLSTSPIISVLSGRGLGLAIVREKAQKLGGDVSVSTKPGAGTEFRMLLPLTVAALRAIVVRVGDARFVVPKAGVERVLIVENEAIATVENRETLSLEGEAMALVRLAAVLGMGERADTGASTDRRHAFIGTSASTRIAFLVDEVVQETSVLFKNLGRQLARVRNIAGATILGDGAVVPVLNVQDLIDSAIQADSVPVRVDPAPGKAAAQKSILVVEDSVTARALIKNILESAGYRVGTAVDGVDALTALKTDDFDLVVSDVEMPRMDGFDLTAKIRADKQLGEMPVVLVTALASAQHRERGVEVGANAYIVKSSFDQSDLLDVVRRLI